MTLSIESLQSDAVAHKLLVRMHESAGPNPAALYRVAAKVGACARQAIAFESTSDRTEWATRPMIEYYAMLHWIKVLLHLCILDYPPSSAVLQHGMSSRRIKRENYRWPLESVYLYKQGVLQSFHALTWAKEQERESVSVGKGQVEPPLLPPKLVIGTLLGAIPEMHDALALFYPQFTDTGVESGVKFGAASASSGTSAVSAASAASEDLTPKTTSAATALTTLTGVDPPAFPTSEWFPRFVLLFSLSGLVRYNPVEWSDILVWSNESDAYLIREFLSQPRFRFKLNDFIKL